MPAEEEESSELSDPPSSSEEERDENAPPRRRRGPSSRRLRKAREKKQKAAATAAKAVNAVERFPPCLACLNSATGGRSDGICYEVPNERRYERCVEGGSCKKIPKPALPVALYFLDYCRAHPGPTKGLDKDEQKIKEKRRIAAKVILEGIADNTFPDKHDIRLREAGVTLD